MLKTNSKTVVFTISAKNRLPSAMVCRDTFKEYNSDIDFVTFLCDGLNDDDDVGLVSKVDSLIAVNELKQMPFFNTCNKLEEMAYKYDIVEYCTAIKPFCIEYLMWSGYDKVLYFDPDIEFFDKIKGINDTLNEYNCVLTPHITSPYKQENEINILNAGVYNLGFCAFSLSQTVIDFLHWWQQKLMDYCFRDVNKHMFVDQYWMSLAPSFLHTYILKHPGCNVAYWNLHEREFKYENGKWFVNHAPLVFYHYSGLNYNNPYYISVYQTKYKLSNRPELTKLFQDYLQKIDSKDGIKYINKKYFYDEQERSKYIKTFTKTSNPWINKQSDVGINIIGYFPYIIGTAEVARNFVQKINSTGIPYALYPLRTTAPTINLQEEQEFRLWYTNELKYDISIFFVNLDQISLLKTKQPELFKRKNIGVFWWEAEGEIPYYENMACVDILLCFSNYTYRLFKHKFGGKTYKLPYPFIAPKQGQFNADITLCKKRLHIEPDEFVFYFNFDYASSIDRKNPCATIKAFAQAYKENTKSRLVIKTLNAERYPNDAKKLNEACNKYGVDDKVLLIEGPLSKSDIHALTNMCDCYISLHKSEGCGIGILHAMYFGKPVIATAYGGAMDVMNESNSLPVEYKKETLTENIFKVYRKGNIWANPNIDDATEKMIKIMKDESLRKNLSRQAHNSMVDYSNMQKFNSEFY
jgi:glycosyltransferase involved in cell wall biosynthesis